MYSFLCGNAIPPPCLAVLLTILRLLLCRSLVSIHTLSSSVFFNQVSVMIMKLVFSSSPVSTICCFYSLLFLHLLLLFLYCLSYWSFVCNMKRPLWWPHLNEQELKFGRSTPLVLTSCGEEWVQFGRSTLRSASRSTPQYWHLVVKNEFNLADLPLDLLADLPPPELTSSGQD